MTPIGYHASHEQLAPSVLLRHVQHAEAAGFEMAMCSDHLAPWSAAEGESGFAWSWLGAALQGTSLRFGVVTAPGQRYHPVVIAHAIATLAEMYPGRFWAALGSGENINEHVTGDRWPPKGARVKRLVECADVIRRLLRGEEVTHHGHVEVDRAQLWTLPAEPPPLVAAAVSPESASTAATWADALITVVQPVDVLREVLDAWGGRGPASLQVHVSWAATDDEALALARQQWGANCVGAPHTWDAAHPSELEARAAELTDDDVRRSVLVSSDLAQHAAWLVQLRDLGFDEIYLHHVGKEQAPFIDAFGEKVLPEVRGGP